MLVLLSKTGYPVGVRIVTYVAVLVVLLFIVSCNSPGVERTSVAQVDKTPPAQANSTPVAKVSSSEADKSLTKLYNDKNCKEFFQAFPNTFQEFDRLYGYDEDKGESKLYSKYEEHIQFLFDCSAVSDLEKIDKIVKIGIGGRMETGAHGELQDRAFDFIKDHPAEAKEILDPLPEDKGASFWFFMLDGPHPTDKKKVGRIDLLRKIFGEKSKQSMLILGQYAKLRASDEH